MPRGLNKVQIIGNLGADPEMRYTPSGSAVTNFRVAVSRNRRGQDGNMVDETEWFRCVAWDTPSYKLAEICNEYLRKGRQVYVEGRLQSRKYTDKDGIERTSVEIVVNDMVMIGGREEGELGQGDGGGRSPQRESGGFEERAPARPSGNQGGGGGGRAPQRPPARPANDDFDSDLDDVPFD
jgi:single-strand DNA-binding protein